MKKVLLVLLIPIVLTLVVHFAARAETIYLGEPIAARTFACDTEEQISSILDAHRDHGLETGRARAMMLSHTLNENGEPACVSATFYITPIRIARTYDMPSVGVIHVLEVQNERGILFFVISTVPVERKVSGRAT